ncbi:MAG: metallopeptidase family protein [Clostridiaceae bacterium]
MESIDIDRATELLTELADELPDEIFSNLNLGIRVSEEVRYSPESSPGDPLYMLGQYSRNRMGRQIVIFYGSFQKVFGHLDEVRLKERLKETLHHELLHHLESQGGEFGLEFEDHLRLQSYRDRVRRQT